MSITTECVSSGWQPRWFVLQNGFISYYDSEDDVGKGSKGSIKMSVCEIKGEAAVLPLNESELSDTSEIWCLLPVCLLPLFPLVFTSCLSSSAVPFSVYFLSVFFLCSLQCLLPVCLLLLFPSVFTSFLSSFVDFSNF